MAIINGQEVFFFPTGNASGGSQEGSLYRHLVEIRFTGYLNTEDQRTGRMSSGYASVAILDNNSTAYTQQTVSSIRNNCLAIGHICSDDGGPPLYSISSIDFSENGIAVHCAHLYATPIEYPTIYISGASASLLDIYSVADIVTKIPVDVLETEGGGGSTITVDPNYSPTSPNAQSGTAVAEAVQESKSYTDQQIASVGTSSESVTVPAYWETMVAEKTATVKALQTAGGKNCVSFVWASDTHIPDNHIGQTTHIGKVMAKMLDNCEIPFAMISGDIGTRAAYDTEEKLLSTQAKIPQHLAPLWGTDRLLMALGNHDGCWGLKKDASGNIIASYRNQFNPERMWQVYFRGQALDFRRVFSDDGLYFFVDNTTQKTRFIVLNSHFGGEYAEDENGWAVNNRFSTSCYGQAQLDWLANVALDMPEGYGAVITAHAPPNINYNVDRMQLIGIINAYYNKTTFEGSYTAGKDGWTNSTVSVDFTDAKGEILAMFAGHVHGDSVDTTTLACPLITILSAGAKANEPYSEPTPSRASGTETETSFDVVTINRSTGKIYCTRVGGGADRVIPEEPTPDEPDEPDEPDVPDEPDTPVNPTGNLYDFETMATDTYLNKRINSSAEDAPANGYVLTPRIAYVLPAGTKVTVRTKGVPRQTTAAGQAYGRILAYKNADDKYQMDATPAGSISMYWEVVDEGNGVYSYSRTIDTATECFRFCFFIEDDTLIPDDVKDLVITINEEISTYTNLAENGTFVLGRINSSGDIVDATGNGSYPEYAQAMEEYIPVSQGDKFYVKGLGALGDYNTGLYWTDSTGAIKAQSCNKASTNSPDSEYLGYSYDATTGVVTLEIRHNDTSHIRFAGVPRDESGTIVTTTDHIIITKNEEIV